MRNQLKSAALGIGMVFGIASVAHATQQTAQPGQGQMPQSSQVMGQAEMMGGTAPGSMMSNPEMRERMSAMMERCHRMMSRMNAEQNSMSGMQQRE